MIGSAREFASSARDAVIAESTPPAQRGWAFGFHRAMDHLAAAIGPMLATLILEMWPESLQMLFLLTIVPGVVVVAILVFGLARAAAARSPPAQPFVLSLKPLSGNFRLYLVSLVVFTLGNSSDLFLLARSGQLGVPEALLPMMWFVFHVAKSAGNMLVGRHGRTSRGAAADLGRLAGVCRGVFRFCPGQRGVARLGLVPDRTRCSMR